MEALSNDEAKELYMSMTNHHISKIASKIDPIITELIQRNISGCCIPASILVAEIIEQLGYPARVVTGLTVSKVGYAFWHCWVKTNYVDIDVGTYITRTTRNALQVPYILYEGFDAPDPIERIDLDNVQERKEVACMDERIAVFHQGGYDAYYQSTLNDPSPSDIYVSLRQKYVFGLVSKQRNKRTRHRRNRKRPTNKRRTKKP